MKKATALIPACGLWKNSERKIHNFLQMVILALTAVLINRFGTGS
jgi:hypothetical protein